MCAYSSGCAPLLSSGAQPCASLPSLELRYDELWARLMQWSMARQLAVALHTRSAPFAAHPKRISPVFGRHPRLVGSMSPATLRSTAASAVAAVCRNSCSSSAGTGLSLVGSRVRFAAEVATDAPTIRPVRVGPRALDALRCGKGIPLAADSGSKAKSTTPISLSESGGSLSWLNQAAPAPFQTGSSCQAREGGGLTMLTINSRP